MGPVEPSVILGTYDGNFVEGIGREVDRTFRYKKSSGQT